MSARNSNIVKTQQALQGVGVGLRAPHVNQILSTRPHLDWFELLADNHMVEGGWARQQAIEISNLYPVTMHCVGMSIGSVDPINYEYLDKVKSLARDVKPKLISDHLCWTSLHSHYSHDLLPLPYTEEVLKHLANRISIIQDYIDVQIAVENISAYLTYKHSCIDEVDFINQLAETADCLILFDINNVYVNQKNSKQNADDYIDQINLNRIAEIHLAGFEDKGHYYLDAHNNPVSEPVWDLFRRLMLRNNSIPTLIEWDHEIPEFQKLFDEAKKALSIKACVESKVREGESCERIAAC